MCAVALNDATHTQGGSTFQQGAGNDHVCLGNGVASTGDGQDTVMNALDNLGDACLDSSLIAQLSNVLSTLADNDAGLLGGDNGADGQLCLSILFVCAGGRLAIGTETAVTIVELDAVETGGQVVAGRREVILGGRHDVEYLLDGRRME